MSERHLASALELVTDGHATRDVRASWRRRGLLITPATRAQAIGGRPLVYSRLALIEGRLLYEAGQDGIDLAVIAGAFRARIEHEGSRRRVAEARGAVVGGYLNDVDLDPVTLDAAVRSGGLREFEALEPGENDRYWLITVEGRQVRCVAGELVHLPAALARILTPHRVHVPVVVTNVSAAVRCVDRALARK
jgi:hypothetical protein